MDGRRPTGIMYVNTHVDDAAKYDDYNNWYHAVHFPDVTEPGIFVNPIMFHNIQDPPETNEGRFLAFYECYWNDLDAAYGEFMKTVSKLHSEFRIHPATQRAFIGVYRTLATVFSTDRRKRSQSVLALRIECKDEARVEEMKRWYAEEHVPEVVSLGLFHTGTFGEMIQGEAFRSRWPEVLPRWIALYESDIGDPRALTEETLRRLPDYRRPEHLDVVARSMFYRTPG